MITIKLNNELIQIEKNCSLQTLLTQKGYQENCYAIALNQQFIPRAHHPQTQLTKNDIIDIILPMQGG